MRGRAIVGLLFCLGVAGGVTYLLRKAPGAETLARRLVDHASGRMETLEITFQDAERPSSSGAIRSTPSSTTRSHCKVAS